MTTSARPTPRRFVVYCDESRHDPHDANGFMGIGGLWVPGEERDDVKFELDRVARSFRLKGELKWSKVSAKHLDAYKAFVNVFARRMSVQFRIIVVDQKQLDVNAFHNGDRELGFYKFYYEMLVKWLEPNTEYVILLDHRVNSAGGRYSKLREILDNSIGYSTHIRQLSVVDSKQSRLAQLADLLTGAITAAWCKTPAGTPKAELQRYLCKSIGRSSLIVPSASPAPSKLNIFQIRLQPARR